REGHEVDALASGDEALGRARADAYDLVISDVRLGDGADGMEVLAAFTARAPQTPVILITAFGDVTGAMAAIQKGAYDYVSKPFNVEELKLTVKRALERRRIAETAKPEGEMPVEAPLEDLVGKSPARLDVYKLVARVATTAA